MHQVVVSILLLVVYLESTAAAECGKPEVQHHRVIGGKAALHGSWPWQAAIYYRGFFDTRKHHCGGSLITPQWIVTAAHCMERKFWQSRFTVILGDWISGSDDEGEQHFTIEKIIRHPKYNQPIRTNNDIALIKIDRPALLNKKVKTICLPQSHDSPVPKTPCYITGWGRTKSTSSSSPILMQALLPVVDTNICNAQNKASTGLSITDAMICGGSGDERGGCQGDSGGPYVCLDQHRDRWVLHGAVSWGSKTCNARHTYTVFARVAHFRDWILKNID